MRVYGSTGCCIAGRPQSGFAALAPASRVLEAATEAGRRCAPGVCAGHRPETCDGSRPPEAGAQVRVLPGTAPVNGRSGLRSNWSLAAVSLSGTGSRRPTVTRMNGRSWPGERCVPIAPRSVTNLTTLEFGKRSKSCFQSAPTRKRRLTCGSFHQPRSTEPPRLHIQRS